MAQYANNLSPIDLSGINSNGTVANLPGVTISAQASDAMLAFFEKFTGNSDSAQVLASSIIFTSAMQGIDPIGLLNEFKNLQAGQLNNYLAAFININRVPTSLLGVQNQPRISKYVQRAILP
jgi:hypothetical protein